MIKDENVFYLSDLVTEEYRRYQLYTLMDRAIPYLVDGLKPSQRRILYTLYKNKNKGLLKVSSATGLVLSLHPHGPASIEKAIVNMAQDFTFSNNYPLIDKKGFFGGRMEPAPAASRYIECKLSSIADFILFDDLNQVEMKPNYDDRMMEPVSLLPKIPLMLINGAEGIGTGYSTMIPSFNHRDIINSMIEYIKTGKAKKIKPWVNNYNNKVTSDRDKYLFHSQVEKIKDKYVITELPKGYDKKKTYKILNELIDQDVIRDYKDESKDNNIHIELIFKRGYKPQIGTVEKLVSFSSSIVPNYTLISENGVEVFSRPEEIIQIFTEQRINVVKKRYELLLEDIKKKIKLNNEIIRFIKEKHYNQAEKKRNRQDYIKYLSNKKFFHKEYLADMSIYRMTKEEVSKRQLLIKEDAKKQKEYQRIVKSIRFIKKKLIEELQEVGDLLANDLRKRK